MGPQPLAVAMEARRAAVLAALALLLLPAVGAEGARVEVRTYDVLGSGGAIIGDIVELPVLDAERRASVVLFDERKAELGLPGQDPARVAALLCVLEHPDANCGNKFVFCGRLDDAVVEGWSWIRVDVYTLETPVLPDYTDEPGFPGQLSACGGVPQLALRGTVTVTFTS